MTISQLGYLRLDVAQPDAWRDLAIDVLGAQVRNPGASNDELQLRFDANHHRVSLRRAQTDALTAIGLEACSPAALESVRNAVSARGIATTQATSQELRERMVEAMFRFRDPDGFPIEVYFGPFVDEVPFVPSRAMSGFSCGALGLGHVLLVSRDVRAAARFYQEVMGFALTDTIVWDEAEAIFLHCNARHHSIALSNECFGLKGGDLQHLMLEVNEIADVGRAYDVARRRKLPFMLDLGQHANDRMTSFYVRTPSGFALEYGWGGVLVDDHWQVKRYSAPAAWGHENVSTEPCRIRAAVA